MDDLDNPLPSASLDQALKELEAEGETAIPLTAEEMAAHPKAQETYDFTVEIVDGAGRKLGGKFKNKILSAEEKGKVGLLIAKFTKNTPWAILDPDTQYLYTMLAHLILSLVEKPKGFSLGEGKNMRLIEAVYVEVASHEAYFRGPPPAPPASDI